MKEVRTSDKPLFDKGENSSKGNQAKWNIGDYWYKADQFGHESLSEVICSKVLEHSNYTHNVLIYDFARIDVHDKILRGCASREFKINDEKLIPLERLHRIHTGFSLTKTIAKFSSVKERIKYTVEFVENVTGIIDFGEYLTVMLEMDALFFNEDRHLNNISLLYSTDTAKYRFSPYYDMGLACFSDTRIDFPFELDYFACEEKIKAKPFSLYFDEQLDAATALYGDHLKFDISKSELLKVFDQVTSTADVVNTYSKEEFTRVYDVLRYQATKYSYMFC